MNENRQLIRFDWAAKRILRDKANFDVLEGFVKVLLRQDIKIVEILEGESNQDCADSKYNRVDIMARNDKGELIIIEIQLTRQVHYLERILFGVGKALSDHMHVGDRYSKVKKVYSISILYFNIGKGDDYIYCGRTTFRGMHTGTVFELSDRDREFFKMKQPEDVFPEYYLICVTDFNKKATTPLEEWIDYLKTGNVRSDTVTPGLKEAEKKLDYLTMSVKEKRAYESYMDAIVNEKECLDTAHMEGLAEGRIEGRAQGRAEGLAEGLAEGHAKGKAEGMAEGKAEGERQALLEVARRMLAAGTSKDVIISITGLTESDINTL